MGSPRIIICVILSLLTCTFCHLILWPHKEEKTCVLSQEIIDDIASYANVTNQIIDYFTKGPFKGQTYSHLEKFINRFGNRLTGSQNLENAIDYMVNLTKEQGVTDVHTENVEIPHWVRGQESATLLEPTYKNLPMLGLGSSVGTPPEGITAQAIVVKSYDELYGLADNEVVGKIVVYAEPFVDYDSTVTYRLDGASKAAKRGAVAALVRSIAPFSLGNPHTGEQEYEANVTKIPVAAITLEDADELWRMQNEGQNITIKLNMSPTSDTKVSRNTIVDVKGWRKENKVVVVSGHLDSWDVGEGAMDDGGGAFISWVVPVVLQKLNLQPERTLRTILWTGEEQSYIGAIAYEKEHRADNQNINFVMESDTGTFNPLGLSYIGDKAAECIVREILTLFSAINATQINVDEPQSVVSVWSDQGIPSGGLYNENDKYFWFHHSSADTMSVIEPDVLDRCAAFWTAFAFVVADMATDMP